MCNNCKSLAKQLNEVLTPELVNETILLVKQRDMDHYPGDAPAQPLKNSQYLLEILSVHLKQVMKDNL